MPWHTHPISGGCTALPLFGAWIGGFRCWLQLVHCAYLLTSLSILYRAESQSPRSSKIHGIMEFSIWSQVQGLRSLVGSLINCQPLSFPTPDPHWTPEPWDPLCLDWWLFRHTTKLVHVGSPPSVPVGMCGGPPASILPAPLCCLLHLLSLSPHCHIIHPMITWQLIPMSNPHVQSRYWSSPVGAIIRIRFLWWSSPCPTQRAVGIFSLTQCSLSPQLDLWRQPLHQVKSLHMYPVLVDYILKITTVPVHDSRSIAFGVNHGTCVYVCSCPVMSHPYRLVLEGISVGCGWHCRW